MRMIRILVVLAFVPFHNLKSATQLIGNSDPAIIKFKSHPHILKASKVIGYGYCPFQAQEIPIAKLNSGTSLKEPLSAQSKSNSKISLEDTCTQLCKKFEWMKWRKLKKNLYSASFKGDSVALEFDPNTGVFNTGQYNIMLATTIFSPMNIDSIPAPVMPGIPSVTTLIHTMRFVSVNNIPEALILVGSYPNEQYPRLSLPHIGRLKAFDRLKNQLDLPDVCVVFQDPYFNNFSPPTMVTMLQNEIQFRVSDPNINDGGIVVLKGLPSNTDYIEISHYNQNSSNDDGIFIDFGVPACCPDWNLSFRILPCTGDSNRYSCSGFLKIPLPFPTTSFSLFLDNQIVQSFNPPFSDSLYFEIKNLYPDGMTHQVEMSNADFPDCKLSFQFTAPTVPASPVITGQVSLCEHDSLQLGTDPAGAYQWSGPNFFQSAMQNPKIWDVGPQQSGRYFLITTDANGCTSSSFVDIQILKNSTDSLSISNCDSAIVNGTTYKNSGTYTQKLVNSNLCDSILTIYVNIANPTTSSMQIRACDSSVINNQIYTTSGKYTQKLISSKNCDSILTIDLDIRKSTKENYFFHTCDTVRINGILYTRSGTYTQLLQNTAQCDSVLSLNLEIPRSTSSEFNLGTCDSVQLNGEVFKNSGRYFQLISNAAGCDSMITLNLYLPKSNLIKLQYEACDSIVINNTRYKVSGTYQQVYKNMFGCDSSLQLDINILSGSLAIPDAGRDTSICEGESVLLKGTLFGKASFYWESESGTFEDDSLLQTSYLPRGPGFHYVYLNSHNICSDGRDTALIQVIPKNTLQIQGDSLGDPCHDLILSVSGAQNYSWSPADRVECLDPPCSRIRLRGPGPFVLMASTNEPCTEPALFNINLAQYKDVLFVPNVFSPNGDNVNDLFLPLVFCENLVYFHMEIFDRWGNKVFESFLPDIGWNGRFKEQAMNPAVFTYVIHYRLPGTGENLKKGDVTLLK